MEEEEIKEKRLSVRFPTNLKAVYSLEEDAEKTKECTVINISLNGAGLEFYTSENIGENTKLFLKISIPERNKAVHIAGIARWVKRGKRDFVCGVKLFKPLDKANLTALGLT